MALDEKNKLSESSPVAPEFRRFPADRMEARIYKDDDYSNAAAAAIAMEIGRLIQSSGRAIGIFDAGEQLRELFDKLSSTNDIVWTRVVGFQLAEILGEGEDSPGSCRRFLIENLVRRVPMAEFNGIRGEAANPQAVCKNYEALLNTRPPDFAVLSVGADGSLGALRPNACDFHESALVKVVRPGAITLTLPAILSCDAVYVVAAGEGKAQAVRDALLGPVSEGCPASILRIHPNAVMFLDSDAAGQLFTK